jgi:hypothetical protein
MNYQTDEHFETNAVLERADQRFAIPGSSRLL